MISMLDNTSGNTMSDEDSTLSNLLNLTEALKQILNKLNTQYTPNSISNITTSTQNVDYPNLTPQDQKIQMKIIEMINLLYADLHGNSTKPQLMLTLSKVILSIIPSSESSFVNTKDVCVEESKDTITTKYIESLISLDKAVSFYLMKCKCDPKLDAVKISNETYIIKNRKFLIRKCGKRYSVRVGGGWKYLEDVVQEIDPCCQKKRTLDLN